MRVLTLLRHAKSSWSEPGLRDFDRPLNARGRKACALIAEHLRKSAAPPDLVLCSPAERTRETWVRINGELGWTCPVNYDDRLYATSSETLLGRLRQLPEAAASVLLIGHNPAIHELALTLCGRGKAGLVDRLEEKFPTGAFAQLHLGKTGWSGLKTGDGHLIDFVAPRRLPRPC